MALPAAYALTDTIFTAGLTRLLGNANRVQVTHAALVSADLTVYNAAEANWLAAPPPVITVNGAPPALPPVIDGVSGTVTFGAPQEATDIIAASFTFAPYVATDLAGLLQDAFLMVEGRLGASLSDVAVPRGLVQVITLAAYVEALLGLQAQTLEYYTWSIDGRRVNKDGVTLHYDKVILRTRQEINEKLAWLSGQYLAEASAGVVLNIDRGARPNIHSRWSPDA